MEGRSCNLSRMCYVPFLTNEHEVEDGEELILQMQEKKSPQKEKKRDWKVAFAENKAKASAKASKDKREACAGVAEPLIRSCEG